MPTLFVPHGAPTFVLQPGAAGEALATFAHGMTRPRAVLIVSAHWETDRPTFGIAPRPETMHDFYGFPKPLYDLRYPAAVAVPLAMEARTLLEEAGFDVALDPTRGLDHGAWIPLMLMYPQADVPVLALSVQPRLGAAHHYHIGEALAPLRGMGVLVVGSGNLTHNLQHFHQWRGASGVPGYVPAFQGWVRERLESQDVASLLDYRRCAPGAEQAHPTDEHWLPFYVALGAAGAGFATQRLYTGIEYNMLAMDSYAFWPESTTTQGAQHV